MTVLITGGTKGIGLGIAERLARPAATLVLAYNSDDAAAREGCGAEAGEEKPHHLPT